jgi:pimeloyl-ACP methyl ester carboxylesterase
MDSSFRWNDYSFMEKTVQIKTPDKKIIDGVLRGSIKKPLIVLVHGLCGNMNEALHFNAATYFEKAGFASFRFGLYSWGKHNRKLHECTLKTHGQDIDTVVAHLRSKGAKQIFLVGHSYGFPSILNADTKNIQAIVSWDGSMIPHSFFKGAPRVNKPSGYLLDEGYLTLIGDKMFQEAKTGSSISWLEKATVPIKIITTDRSASEGNLAVSKKMMKHIKGPKELTIIRGASHDFTEDGAQEKVYKETARWIKKYL